MKSTMLSAEHRVISEMIKESSSVLDLGCGDGSLLKLLEKERSVKGQGIEIDESSVYKCVEKGVSVFHGDIETGLMNYPDNAFDYVILNQSMQETKRVDYVLNEAFRVGENVIIGFPNFANLYARFRLFFRGKTPVTQALPYRWYDTPNLHFLSISDFKEYCRSKEINIKTSRFLRGGKEVIFWPNLFADVGIFVVNKMY